VPLNIVAGNTFEANFSFKYLNDFSNPTNSPLIIQLNFSSDNENYPVWRGDFEVSGRVEKYALWGYIHTGTIYFECNSSESQTIEHPLDSQTVQADNGTFYCYNEDADLQLEEYDKVYLDITSHQAIYPGAYDLTASMFYLTDEKAPIVNIVNKEAFDLYYGENDKVSVIVDATDGSEIIQIYGEAQLGSENILFTNPVSNEGLYYFQEDTPEDIAERDYSLYIFAEDENNNIGNDSVTLKIDTTAPEIIVIKPGENESYHKELPIELSVSDWKSGVDSSSVKFRIREINNGTICPETGGGFNYGCLNTEWLNATLKSGDSASGIYEATLNISEMNEGLFQFWLEVEAEDILGNKGEWVK
ncbi:MAG: hypothetical protein ABIF18_04225, partial [archaeon]